MTRTYVQPSFDDFPQQDDDRVTDGPTGAKANVISEIDKPFHEWYRFVLSYPPHLVRDYIRRFELPKGANVLDPFCGTGTTVVEAKLNGLHGVGLEANPFPQFASSVKVQWDLDPDGFTEAAERIAAQTRSVLKAQGIDDSVVCSSKKRAQLRDISSEARSLLIANSISPMPLHKTLALLETIDTLRNGPYYSHARLALGNALVTSISNLRFGPEVGVGKLKEDVPVVQTALCKKPGGV